MYRLKRDPKELFAHDTHPELPLDPDVVQPGAYKWPPHFTPSSLLIVFIGGCIGALARYWVTLQLPTSSSGWPAATFIVNLLGAFLLGFLLEGLIRLGSDEGAWRIARLGIGTGFMGAFTTYSTFAVETDLLLRNHHSALAVPYVIVSLLGGVLLSYCAWTQVSLGHAYYQRDWIICPRFTDRAGALPSRQHQY